MPREEGLHEQDPVDGQRELGDGVQILEGALAGAVDPVELAARPREAERLREVELEQPRGRGRRERGEAQEPHEAPLLGDERRAGEGSRAAVGLDAREVPGRERGPGGRDLRLVLLLGLERAPHGQEHARREGCDEGRAEQRRPVEDAEHAARRDRPAPERGRPEHEGRDAAGERHDAQERRQRLERVDAGLAAHGVQQERARHHDAPRPEREQDEPQLQERLEVLQEAPERVDEEVEHERHGAVAPRHHERRVHARAPVGPRLVEVPDEPQHAGRGDADAHDADEDELEVLLREHEAHATVDVVVVVRTHAYCLAILRVSGPSAAPRRRRSNPCPLFSYPARVWAIGCPSRGCNLGGKVKFNMQTICH